MEFKISLKKLNELQNKINILDKNVLVSTQNGFKKIKAIGVTSPQSDKIIIKTVDFELSGSPSHRVKYLNEWFFLKDLKIGDYVNTINGIQTIISISNDNNKEDLWDIEVDGGVDNKTIAACAKAGANVFVAGSYLFKNHDLTAQVQTLRDAIDA